MNKKIIDIAPPGESNNHFEEKNGIKKIGKIKFSKNKAIWLFLAVFLAALVGAIYLSPLYSKVYLSVYPTVENKDYETEIEINSNQDKIDLLSKIIPGKILEKKVYASKSFKATGEKSEGGRASGIIKVYNASKRFKPIKLVEKTRFLSSDKGKIFRAVNKIYIPAAKKINGNIIPGVANVKVVAQDAGEDYNVKPSKFSVPGLKGTALYYAVWGESTSPMSGGFKKTVKIISSDDLLKAKNSLMKILVEKAISNLKPKSNLNINKKISRLDNFDIKCTKKEGEVADAFQCNASADVKFMAFATDNLYSIAKNYLDNNLPSLKGFDGKNLVLVVSPENTLNSSGKVIANLKIKARIYDKISKDLIVSQIEGKKTEEAKNIIFYNYPKVKKVEFLFKPFWANLMDTVPRSKGRIKISILFD